MTSYNKTIVDSITLSDSITHKYGRNRRYSIYITDSTNGEKDFTGSLIDVEVVKRINKLWSFSAKLIGINSTDRTKYLSEGNEVKIFSGLNCIFKGRLEKPRFDSYFTAELTGFGIANKLGDRYIDTLSSASGSSGRQQYSNVATNTIINELASVNGDGSSPWILEPSTNTNYGSVSVRFEEETRLKAISDLCNAIGYEWWESYGAFPYDKNYINVDSKKGSSGSVYTFYSAGDNQNIKISKNEKDYERLSNYIIVLGRGDGINQLKSIIYHATDNRTTLASALTKTATTVSVTDASVLPSSGSVWIGCEKVSYTGKSGNDLTGCTRGVAFLGNVTEAYAHEAGIAVYDAQYTTTSPETDSSIDKYGVKEHRHTDKSVINQNTLDRIAQKILNDRYEPPQVIEVIPSDPHTVLDTVVLGDTVTVNDNVAGLTADYRIVGMYIGMKRGLDTTKFELANKKRTFLEEMQEDRDLSDKQGSFMQGSTNCYVTGETDNCDATHGLRIDFFIPDEAVAVNSVKLSYRLSDYRVWSTTASSSGTHTHSVTGVTSGASSLSTTNTNDSPSGDDILLYNTAGVDIGTSWTTISNESEITTGDTFGVFIFGTMLNCTGSIIDFGDINLRVRATKSGETTKYFPHDTYTNFTVGVNNGVAAYAIFCEGNLNGWTLSLQAQSTTGSTISYVKLIGKGTIIGTHTHGMSHTHNVSGQTAESSGAHTHPIAYGISTYGGAWPVSDITIKVDGVDKTSDIEAAKGSALVASENGTENGNHMELSSYLSTPIAGNWHYIEINPNGNCRITSDIYVQVFINSE